MPNRRLGGRLGRGARLAGTGVRGAAGLAAAKARRMAGGGDDELVAFHEELAVRLVETLGEMKGAAMKLGQILSFVDLDLPEEVRSVYHETLASLRDDAPSFDLGSITDVIAEEYGAPVSAVFASFDPEPLASASIGQVHAATLDDGRDVVVKVQYPGVADAVRADLRNAGSFLPLARLLSPNLEVEPLLEELQERVSDELDYAREAQYQRAFATRYEGHPFIHVPEVIADLCRARVLVSERVHGRTFDDFTASADAGARQRVGEIIFRYAFGSIGRFRLFNGDPHPGNYLVHDGAADGGLAVSFLDYGSVKMFSRERYAQMSHVDDAVVSGDREAFLDGMRRSGFIPPGVEVDEERLFEWFRLFSRPEVAEQPFTFTPAYAAEVLRTTTDLRSEYREVLRKLNLPPDYLLLNRIQWGINSVLGRLLATADWRAIRDEYVHDGPASSPLGELDAAWWRQRNPAIDPPA